MESLIIGYASHSNNIKGKAAMRAKLGSRLWDQLEFYPINLNERLVQYSPKESVTHGIYEKANWEVTRNQPIFPL